HLFLATEGGLFESDDHGKNWFRMENFSKREPVVLVRVFDERLFAATRRRLYLSRDLNHFQPVFSLLSGGDEEFLEIEDEFSGEEGEITASVSDFRELLASGGNHLLWLATRKGVFENRKGENTWRPLSLSGLQSSDISFLTYSEKSGTLFAGSPSGVYEYIPHQKRWKEIFQGLARREVKALTLIPGENEILAVVTPEGLMRYQILPEEIPPATVWIPSPDRTALFSRLIRLEPPPVKIYKAVMRFANLKNGKIKRWHSASRLAALLPTFSFGKDFSENNNVDIDRGSTSEADKFIFGPSDTDRGWDMDVSWDLGDFIWSSNQTSIDGREKLMVELRHDFLSEATRIYYERRRLQMEMIFLPPPTEQEHFSQLLRLEELTALLDSMTDGWMSQELEKIYEGHPEFSRLWEFQAGKS
ncbi:MAG: hypothetical protein HYZ83_07770, partial [Candidatus Omnitrophica bacterium]|nr:hypothetical protein [Candidatus Omnitrophota bacterium]